MRAHLDRRTFIRDMGKGVIGIAVGGVALAACGGSESGASTTAAGTAATSATTGATSTTAAPSTTETPPTSTEPTTSTGAATGGIDVRRVDLGFVSAYVLVRGTEAAIVDTGVGGSAGQIEAALSEVGLGWTDVGNVIVTHRHGDHAGSLGEVAAAAVDAVLGTGAADVDAMSAPRPIEAYEDGQSVFGLEIVATPGHTPGHVAVWDPAGAVLFAGDAINGADSGASPAVEGVAGPNPQFTPDMAGAIASVGKLAALQPDAIYFGHGSPMIGGAAAALSTLVEQLGGSASLRRRLFG